MTVDLGFPTEAGDPHPRRLDDGETPFVLGANGTGKSSLMSRFNAQNSGRTRKVSAHWQTWMESDALDLTPSSKLQTEAHIQNKYHMNLYRAQVRACARKRQQRA